MSTQARPSISFENRSHGTQNANTGGGPQNNNNSSAAQWNISGNMTCEDKPILMKTAAGIVLTSTDIAGSGHVDANQLRSGQGQSQQGLGKSIPIYEILE
jgi:hypothetical protein